MLDRPETKLPQRLIVPLIAWPTVAVLGGFFRDDILHFLGDVVPAPAAIFAIIASAPVVCASVWAITRYLPTGFRKTRRLLWLAALVSTWPFVALGTSRIDVVKLRNAALEVMAARQYVAVEKGLVMAFFGAVLATVCVIVGWLQALGERPEGRPLDVALSLLAPLAAAAVFTAGFVHVDHRVGSLLATVDRGLRTSPEVAFGRDVSVSSVTRVGCGAVADFRRCRGGLDVVLTTKGVGQAAYTVLEYPSRADARNAVPKVAATLPASRAAIAEGHLVLVFDRAADRTTTDRFAFALVFTQIGTTR